MPGSVHAFATMRAPWPGLAASVIAMRSVISAFDTMPLAASRSRTADQQLLAVGLQDVHG